MSGLVRYACVRRLQVILGLALMGMVAPAASAQAQQLDTVVASGQTGPSGTFAQYAYINVNVSSSPQGQGVTGSAVFDWYDETVYGQVTCLNVTGANHGVGQLGAATTAIVSIHGYITGPGGPTYGDFELQMIDNGGNGRDVFGATYVGTSPYGDCSGQGVTFNNASMAGGRVVVNDAPTATFTTSPSPATIGTPVTFDASSLTCAAAPCTYAWSDGTAKLGSGTKLTYTFHYAGTKHVLLTLTDAHGTKSTVQHDLQVYARTTTTARFTTGPPYHSGVGTEIAFDASSSTCAAAPCVYAWSDGTVKLGSGTTLTYTFQAAGTKHVMLTLTDAHGTKSTVQHDLTIL